MTDLEQSVQWGPTGEWPAAVLVEAAGPRAGGGAALLVGGTAGHRPGPEPGAGAGAGRPCHRGHGPAQPRARHPARA